MEGGVLLGLEDDHVDRASLGKRVETDVNLGPELPQVAAFADGGVHVYRTGLPVRRTNNGLQASLEFADPWMPATACH